MVDVPGEGRGGVDVQVEFVPVRVHPEERRIEPRVPEVVELLPAEVMAAAAAAAGGIAACGLVVSGVRGGRGGFAEGCAGRSPTHREAGVL